MANPPPTISELAGHIAGAMVAAEPVEALGWAVVRDAAGKGLYLVAVVMGSANADDMADALAKLKPHMKRVDIFDDTPGALGAPPGDAPDAGDDAQHG